jgi:hypothetical protein
MFNDFFEVLKENHFVEKPVDAKTFVESPEYLGQPQLSSVQYDIVEAMSQIYRKEDLQELYGSVEGLNYFNKYTKNEIILQLGKGSGKDFVSTVACAYVVYKLLCLKDPASYYGKPSGDAIDIINVAINAQQAKNVFFKGFKTKIEKSPWFAGKYNPKADSVEFDKAITFYSGHSERESHEGLNLFMAVLDEISGFASEVGTGNEQGKTAENIYKAFRGSVDSRFPDLGKVVLLSFPRYQGDFISQRYESVIAEKETIERRHGGWGCAIFVHKDNYTPIPEEMKLWGQDDWLFVKARNRRKQNYKLVGYRINGELSVTNNILDADSEIHAIRENDLRLKQQYNLF